MEKSYLDRYYPEGITMEDRLFEKGSRLTGSGLGNKIIMIVVGVIVALIGLLIIANSDEIGFGTVVFGIGDLLAIIGIAGIYSYYHGLKCLERAELLYNTRCVSGQKSSANHVKNSSVKKTIEKNAQPDYGAESFDSKQIYGTKLSEDREEFVASVLKTSTEDLQLILTDQRELYSQAEIQIIEEVLKQRSAE